jgi:TRAP-type C4-dicarboxylate transport system substrate-binding protein
MKTVYVLSIITLILTACTQNPAAQDNLKEKNGSGEKSSSNDLKQKKQSIEEAADAAAKLVEEETRAEIEAVRP